MIARVNTDIAIMEPKTLAAASETLWTAWRNGSVMDALPAAQRPANRADGYAVQALLEKRSAKPLYGWKIAATSPAGQKHIGVSGPLAGRLLAEQIRLDGAEISLKSNRMRVAECEFAMKMAKDLAPRAKPYSVDEVMAAVASVHPAIEVPDSRYGKFETAGEAQLIADCACAHLFVLGPAATANWRVLDLAKLAVTGTVEAAGAAPQHHHGSGANVLGDPRVALTWLANELSGLGITLKSGQVITTGACVPPITVKPGERVRGEFGALGAVSVRFVE